jgi:unsaturated rhamnogalacturonyl hydrolase
VLNKARGRALTCIYLCLGLGMGEGRAQLTANERRASVGDAPGDPGALVADLRPALECATIQAAMRTLAKWQYARIADTPSQDWTFATLYLGILAASRTLSQPKYQDMVVQVAEHYDWKLGRRQAHADDQGIGQVYLGLHLGRPALQQTFPLRTQFDGLMKEPNDPAKPLGWWSDALFMAPPVWAGLADVTRDAKYLVYMDHEWHITSDLLWDPHEKLFSRDSSYLDRREKNGLKMFWSRGNGWVMGGLVGVLKHIPANNSRRLFYVKRLQEMAEAVKASQGPDGLWRAGMLDADSYANPEASGSAFFVYALTWGIRHGLLDQGEYQPMVARAWAGLLGHIYADGRLGDVQPVGEAPGAYSPVASYVFDVGAFLLAGSELDAWASAKTNTSHTDSYPGHP